MKNYWLKIPSKLNKKVVRFKLLHFAEWETVLRHEFPAAKNLQYDSHKTNLFKPVWTGFGPICLHRWRQTIAHCRRRIIQIRRLTLRRLWRRNLRWSWRRIWRCCWRFFSRRIFDALLWEAHVRDCLWALQMHGSFDLAPDLLLVFVTRVGGEQDLDLLDPLTRQNDR